MGDEAIGITPTPGGLGRCPSRDLTRWCRTGPLATANASVGHKPMAATAARPLREHAQMLALSAHTGGPFFASKPGSILLNYLSLDMPAAGCLQSIRGGGASPSFCQRHSTDQSLIGKGSTCQADTKIVRQDLQAKIVREGVHSLRGRSDQLGGSDHERKVG